MILKIKEDDFVDIDSIRALRWLPEGFGVAVFDGTRIAIKTREDFDKVKDAYTWARTQTIYEQIGGGFKKCH